MRKGRKGSENPGKTARMSLFIKATVFYIFEAVFKRILEKLGLAILNTGDHKSLIRQCEIGDAFIKSNYDNGILIKTNVRRILSTRLRNRSSQWI